MSQSVEYIVPLRVQDWPQIFGIPVVVEGYFYGLYSAVFAVYIKYQAKKGIKNKNTLLYLLFILYILSTITFVLDVVTMMCIEHATNLFVYHNLNSLPTLVTGDPHSSVILKYLYWTSVITAGLCDFISQAILIYRCWVVWGGNSYIIIIPSILSFTFLATWMVSLDTSPSTTLFWDVETQNFIVEEYIFGLGAHWKYPTTLTSLALSLTVNAIVTVLIVLRIIKVYREAKPTLEDQCLKLSTSGGSKLRAVIFVIIESGMTLFAIQLFRICTIVMLTNFFVTPAGLYSRFIIGVHQMFNGMAPTMIFVRVSMKLSYDDEKSLQEAVGSLRFAARNQDTTWDIGEYRGPGEDGYSIT